MTLLQSFILGLVQGITEFLPISSSAHLILIPWAFGWQDPGLGFDVFLHLGTLVAIAIYFARDWWTLGRAGLESIIERRIGSERERILFWLIIVGSVPAAISGLFFHDQANMVFRAPLLITVSLSFVGFIIYWVDGSYAALKSVDELKLKDAIWIGIAQSFAIIPGISRSGATMAMARGLGFTRNASARYSFLLSFPIVLAAGLFKWKDFSGEQMTLPFSHMLTGFMASMLFGILSIHFLLRYLRFADFRVFAWYRIILALTILVLSLVFQR